MNFEKVKAKSVWILIGLGILIAILSALERHWQWLADLCGSFSSGCHDVRDFTFLSLPIAYWGIGFYLMLALITRFAKSWTFWLVMAAVGVEITFLWIMYSLDMPCLFCLLNAVVMTLLFLTFINKRRIWQTLIIVVISFFAFNLVLTRENRQVVNAAADAKNNAGVEKSNDTIKEIHTSEGVGVVSGETIDIDIDTNPSSGPKDAAITIVEFSDYLCPSCRRLHPVASEMRKLYKDKVRWVFKDFPLRQHRGADKLAEAARCAWDQEKFWDFQDELFMSDPSAGDSILPAIAQSLGLDLQQFSECVESRKYMLEVMKDRQDALNSGISSTPTLLINGRKMSKIRTEEQFKEVIEAESKRLGQK